MNQPRNRPVLKPLLIVAALFAIPCCLVIWQAFLRAPVSLAGGTRLNYSIDLEQALSAGQITPEEAQEGASLMQQTVDIVRERIDPSRGPLGFRKLGARVEALSPRSFIVELPPVGDDGPTEPERTQSIRRLVESDVELEFYIGALEDRDFPGTDRASELARVSAWLLENAAASISTYNALARDEGGPLGQVRWYPRRTMGLDVELERVRPEERLLPVVQQTGRHRFTIEDIVSSEVSEGGLGDPAILVDMSDGRKADFHDFSSAHVGDELAIVLNGEIQMIATILSPLEGSFIIEGGMVGFTQQEVDELTQLIRAGTLPVKPNFESTEHIDEPPTHEE